MVSPEIQLRSIREWAAQNNHIIVAEIVDPNSTGRNFDRRVQDAIALVESSVATDVAVYKFSRFGRNRRGWQLNLGRLNDKGGDLHSSTEEVDANTAAGKFMRGMFGEMAAFESDRFAEQWQDSQALRNDRGLPHTGTPRFGYEHHKCRSQPVTSGGWRIVNPKDPTCKPSGCKEEYRIDPVTGPVLARMYEMYLAGTSLSKIANWLIENHVPSPKGGEWRSTSVGDVLDSGFGAGMLQVGVHKKNGSSGQREREWLPGAQKTVISQDEWKAYQARRITKRGNASSTRTKWPLSGITRCGRCGGPMTCTTGGPSGQRIRGYIMRCVRNQDNIDCPGIWRVTHEVEAALLRRLEEVADELERASRIVAKTVREQRTEQSVIRKRLNAELGSVRQGEARLVDAIVAGVLSHEDAAAKRVELKEKAENLAIELAAVEAPVKAWTPPEIRSLREDWPRLPVETRREIVRLVVKSITVQPNKSIDVVLVGALQG